MRGQRGRLQCTPLGAVSQLASTDRGPHLLPPPRPWRWPRRDSSDSRLPSGLCRYLARAYVQELSRWKDVKPGVKESVLKAQADLQAIEKQYPALGELTTKHGPQSRALLSGNRMISDAAKTQIILVRLAFSFPLKHLTLD